ncbi:hybrid sensor histidine kinase/response regulator transcription factor [Larkinella punicea]|uniref:hybrid sensor histidine kinase/response regulator transcription factor n=1 Tax=Larkinella punicea TaxID=2315727 RepID=UPI001402C560|nr:response regulator [Larkinella punicea]
MQHYSMGEGLPNRGVLTIGQDRQGFIWVGTLNNAHRFDGFTFKTLPPAKTAQLSQSTPFVKAIRTDLDGNLWFFKGWPNKLKQIEILVPGQQKPVSFENLFHRKLPFDLAYYVTSLYRQDPSFRPTDPILIPASDGSIWRYEGKGHFKRFYQHPVSVKLQNLLVTPTGTVLLSFPAITPSTRKQDENDLIELAPNGIVIRRQRTPADLYPVWVDPQGTIYLSQFNISNEDFVVHPPHLSAHRLDHFLFRLTTSGHLSSVPILFPKNPFPDPTHYAFVETRTVYDSKHGLFWFMGKNLLFAWHPQHGVVFDLAASGFPIARLTNFTRLFADRTGAIWVITQNGFLLLTLEANHFQRYLHTSDDETVITRLSTRGIVKAGDWLWVNTTGVHSYGSTMINLKTGQTRKALLSNNGAAISGHDNQIWAASSDTLSQIDPVTLAIRQFPLHKALAECWALWQDGRHNFWMGFDEGLSYFDNHRKQNHPFRQYNQYRELATNRVNGFFPDSSTGGLWVAASSGLYLLDTVRGITARYSSQDAAPHHLPFDHLTFVHPDRTQPGIYWLATRGGGLIWWERRTGRWQQFTRETGLSNNEIYSIHEDRQGRLWLPSSYGLMRFQKKTHQTQVFLPQDGIAHEEFNLTSHFQTSDGQLFLGGLNGVTAFWPDRQMADKPVVVPLMVTGYEQLNASTGQRTDHLADFNQDQRITIPTQNRSFSLTFALLDYRYGRQFRLSYRIIGWQNYWTSQLRRDVAINGLPPGQYQLQVRAQNPSGQWVSDTLTIPITVLTPFYQQTWFVILCLLSLLWLIVGIFRWRNERLIRETKRLEAEVTRRTAQIENDKALIQQQATDLQASATLKARFFANISHEFRTPLTLLLGPLAYLSKRTTEPVTTRLLAGMDRNARQLLAMINDLLDLSKLDVNPVQLAQQSADLAALIHRTVASFAPQADYTGIQLIIEGATSPLWLSLDVAKMETVLKNLLANALRFTPVGGSVTIRLHKPTEWIRMEVIDTGSGIHPNDLPHIFERYYQSQQPNAPLRGGTGIGLALSMEYCKLWGGDLTVDSTLGKGSTFALTCPYQPTAPQETIPVPESKSPEPVLAEAKNHNLSTRILLVEDNPDMAEYLETILSPYYLLHVTRNGREAWQWLSALPVADQPNLIVTDLMMPDMDGLALVNQIRQQPTVRAIPVLMLTARTSQDVKLEALRLGVADYVTKPFDQDELITRIGNLLERSHERTAWQQQLPAETAGSAVPMDDEWLLEIEQLVLKNLTNTQFQVHSIADAVHSSERQLYRRLKKLTGFSPNQFIQEIRLQTAREWLENQQYGTVKEVCYAVGFQDVVYFSRLFLNRFGRYPATYFRTAEVS